MNFDQIADIIIQFLTVSGAAAWVSTQLTNKRGGNKIIDFVLDLVELVAGNVGKSKNDPSTG